MKFTVVLTIAGAVWKYEKFALTENFFRQINYLVISLVKPLLSRNFCQKCVRVNFRNYPTVPHCCGNRNSLTHFWQEFRESNGFTKEITK